MAQTDTMPSIESIHTSLMKALIAFNDGKELTAEQLAFFKQAIESEDTWNQIKATDLVPAKDIIALGTEVLQAMGFEAGRLHEHKDWKHLSAMQRALLNDFDTKLEQITSLLLTKAEHGLTAQDLKLTGNTKWERLARELLERTIKLVEQQRAA